MLFLLCLLDGRRDSEESSWKASLQLSKMKMGDVLLHYISKIYLYRYWLPIPKLVRQCPPLLIKSCPLWANFELLYTVMFVHVFECVLLGMRSVSHMPNWHQVKDFWHLCFCRPTPIPVFFCYPLKQHLFLKATFGIDNKYTRLKITFCCRLVKIISNFFMFFLRQNKNRNVTFGPLGW